MAISMKNWKDRITQYPNRRKLINVSTGEETIVDVVREEGNVTEAGDTFTASNMNDLEDRIDTAFGALTAADIPYSAGVSVADKLDSLKIIKTGKANYTGLKGGGFADRVLVPVAFDSPMPNSAYVAFAMVNDAYNDFPFIRIFPFSKTATGFTAVCINQSGSQTAVGGSFDWVVIG